MKIVLITSSLPVFVWLGPAPNLHTHTFTHTLSVFYIVCIHVEAVAWEIILSSGALHKSWGTVIYIQSAFLPRDQISFFFLFFCSFFLCCQQVWCVMGFLLQPIHSFTLSSLSHWCQLHFLRALEHYVSVRLFCSAYFTIHIFMFSDLTDWVNVHRSVHRLVITEEFICKWWQYIYCISLRYSSILSFLISILCLTKMLITFYCHLTPSQMRWSRG